MNDLKEALKTAMRYNGLNEPVREWKNYPLTKYGYINFDNQYDWNNSNGNTYMGAMDEGALQLIWMILVLMHGNYGTSPRFGWIEDVEGFKKTIDEICEDEEEYDE